MPGGQGGVEGKAEGGPARPLKPPPLRALRGGVIAAVCAAYPRLTEPMRQRFWAGVGRGHVSGPRPTGVGRGLLDAYVAAGVFVPAESVGAAMFVEECHAWCVPAGEHLRLVLHPRISNDAAGAPPQFTLPSPRVVALALTGASRVITLNARAWYYQITLPSFLLGAFRVRAADGSVWALTRWPMGARASAAVAEAATRWLFGVAEEEQWVGAPRKLLTYIDNVLVVDGDTAAVRRRCDEVGVELSEFSEVREGGRGKWVGIEFRVGAGGTPTCTRPSAALVGKWRHAVAIARGGRGEVAARALAGYSVAVLERALAPLAVAGSLLWPRLGPLNAEEERDVARMEELLGAGDWWAVCTPAKWVRMVADASSGGWGVAMEGKGWAGRFGDEAALHINAKELIAARNAVALAPEGCGILLDCDSATVAGWLTAGSAPTRFARALIREVDAVLCAKGGELRVQWVASGANGADALSRGSTSGDWIPPPWRGGEPRRVLGGRTRVGEF